MADFGMDGIERLECVYYPGPIPCNAGVLTTLCFLFDKIHFPNVYLPKGDYDKQILQEEIKRLEGVLADDLRRRSYQAHQTGRLIGMLKFLEYRLPLDGILEFPTAADTIFGAGDREKPRAKMARAIYEANYPPRENFEPIFDTSSCKGLPGSEESVLHAGDFFYQAGAIAYAAEKNLPLIDDGSGDPFGLALPFRARFKDNAPALAAMLAVETLGLVLPDLPLMTCEELVEFRYENAKELKNFRASMRRYAKSLNEQISNDPSLEELNRKAKFIIESEIAPALHDLNRDLQNPNRPWHKRMTDVVRIGSSLVPAIVFGGVGRTVAEAIQNAALFELNAKGDKQEAEKRNGLYYVLKAKALKS